MQGTKSFLNFAIVSHSAKMIHGPKQVPVLLHQFLRCRADEGACGRLASVGVANRASPPSSFACEVFAFIRVQPHSQLFILARKPSRTETDQRQKWLGSHTRGASTHTQPPNASLWSVGGGMAGWLLLQPEFFASGFFSNCLRNAQGFVESYDLKCIGCIQGCCPKTFDAMRSHHVCWPTSQSSGLLHLAGHPDNTQVASALALLRIHAWQQKH